MRKNGWGTTLAAVFAACLLLVGCHFVAEPIPTQIEPVVPENSNSATEEQQMKYNPLTDPFYDKETIYATWINVYNGSTETWWRVWNDGDIGVSGQKQLISGEYKSIDNNDPEHRRLVFEYTRDAGIDALIMDCTNGVAKWLDACKDYQRMCYENGMKFAVAINGADKLESLCGVVWHQFANPESSGYASSYLYKNGKPVLILYCVRSDYEVAKQMNLELVNNFELVWASGEDSEVNKWGWQLEPTVGPMVSDDSVFVTPAVKWYPFVPDGTSDSWRRSLAMLDFAFLAARERNAKYVIVGSFDDIGERNGWSINDTEHAFYQWPVGGPMDNLIFARGLQNRSIYGELSNDVYYNRVKAWLNGEVSSYNPGGTLSDGAYTIVGTSGCMFGGVRPSSGESDLGSVLKRGYNVETNMETYYWFYHLGNDEYRIIKLSSNLSLQAGENGCLVQDWDDAVDSQVWKLLKHEDGSYSLVNKQTGEAICDAAKHDGVISLRTVDEGELTQRWAILPVENRIIED